MLTSTSVQINLPPPPPPLKLESGWITCCFFLLENSLDTTNFRTTDEHQKIGGSALTFMVSRLSYAKTRSVALICDSSTIKIDEVSVQLRHWYRSHMLCHSCTMFSHALLHSLALIHDAGMFTGARRRFDTSFTLTGGRPTVLGAHTR